MAKAKSKPSRTKKSGDSKLFAFLATFLTIIGFIIAIILRRDDDYVMFYAKQGLVLFILQIIISLASLLPIIGWSIIESILWIIFLVVWVISWINALSGEKRDTWLIGRYSKRINL